MQVKWRVLAGKPQPPAGRYEKQVWLVLFIFSQLNVRLRYEVMETKACSTCTTVSVFADSPPREHGLPANEQLAHSSRVGAVWTLIHAQRQPDAILMVCNSFGCKCSTQSLTRTPYGLPYMEMLSTHRLAFRAAGWMMRSYAEQGPAHTCRHRVSIAILETILPVITDQKDQILELEANPSSSDAVITDPDRLSVQRGKPTGLHVCTAPATACDSLVR